MIDWIFTRKWLVFIPLLFYATIGSLHLAVRQIRYLTYIDIDNFWPISIFLPKSLAWQDVITLLAIACFWWLFVRLWFVKASLTKLILVGGVLIIATNLLSGIHHGFIEPIAGESVNDHQYWQDVDRIHFPVSFLLERYEFLQPNLHIHSRVHPPGPMVFIFYLRQIWDNPIFVSVVILAISLTIIIVLFDLLRSHVSDHIAKFTATLFLVLPATQIYFYSTIDAVICMLFIATLWAFQKASQPSWFLLTCGIFWLASFLTFGVVFLLPILLFDDWRRHQNLIQSIKLMLTTAGIYIGFYLLTGYNYLNSFFIAKSFEGQGETYFLTHPLSYTITRLEDVLEILIFFGPYLTVLLGISLLLWFKQKSLKHINSVGVVAIASLLLFFLAGGYYTGETARAALYIYPFLLIPIAWLFEHTHLSEKFQFILLNLVFIQTVLMQTFGWYSW